VKKPRFVRLAETDRKPVRICVDGVELDALEGDTVSVAILGNRSHLRMTEFGQQTSAGFCMMGACQDCWVWTVGGNRSRSCTTTVTAGMNITTTQPEAQWAKVA
jgi:D-hydroxyproline dehydrogenase subunit gamma